MKKKMRGSSKECEENYEWKKTEGEGEDQGETYRGRRGKKRGNKNEKISEREKKGRQCEGGRIKSRKGKKRRGKKRVNKNERISEREEKGRECEGGRIKSRKDETGREGRKKDR